MRSIALDNICDPIHTKGAATAAAVKAPVSSSNAGPAASNVSQLVPRKDANILLIATPNASIAGEATCIANASGIIATPNPARITSAMAISTTLAASIADAAETAPANASMPSPAATITMPALAKLPHSTSLNTFVACPKRYRSPANAAIATVPNNTLGFPKAATPFAISVSKDPANFGTPPNPLPIPASIPGFPPVGKSAILPPPVSLSSAAPPNFFTSLVIPITPLPEYNIANTAGTTATTVSATVPVFPPPVIRLVTEFTPFASFSNIQDTASTAGNNMLPIATASLSNAFPNRANAADTLFCT